MNILPI